MDLEQFVHLRVVKELLTDKNVMSTFLLKYYIV